MAARGFLSKLLIVLSFVLIPTATARADMGRIMTSPAVVGEDAQKAIILHNLHEEVLILGTDLKADANTTLLRFIPFPSEPTVSLAEGDPFQRVAELASQNGLVFVSHSKTMNGGAPSSTPVAIEFSAQLGSHDVTVVRVDEAAEFGAWVKEFLSGKGLQAEDYQSVEGVAADYVQRGLVYFAFDLVETAPGTQSVQPLVYRFKSDKLYYPLKTSNTFGGSGEIDLVIIAPGTLCDPTTGQALYAGPEGFASYHCFKALSKDNPFGVQASTSAGISREDAESIYAPAGELFSEGEPIFLQLVRYNGEYDFDDDILVDISRAPHAAVGVSDEGDEIFDLGDLLTDILPAALPSPPATPETPTTPVTPETPATPATPTTPETSDTPTTPSTPETPLIPTTPETSETPTTPSTPETPSTPIAPANDEENGDLLAKACLKATMAAIDMEIGRFEQKLDAAKNGPGDPANVPQFTQRLQDFRGEREKYARMNPADYTLPEKMTVEVEVTQAYGQGSFLEIEGITRSGPFYHIAGISGDDYASLQPGGKYKVTMYLVYPRDYPFPSYYAYVDGVEKEP